MKAYFFIFLVFIFSGSFAGNVIIENKSFEELKQVSKAANKNLYIDVYTTWCGPCKMMDKETFSQPEVQKAFAKDFIAAKIDLETQWYATWCIVPNRVYSNLSVFQCRRRTIGYI